jgi:hypothetical protein
MVMDCIENARECAREEPAPEMAMWEEMESHEGDAEGFGLERERDMEEWVADGE